jgi:hypothetical protein
MTTDAGRTCNDTDLLGIHKRVGGFSPFGLAWPDLKIHSVQFSRKWCPAAFANLKLDVLTVDGQQIRFYSAEKKRTESLNCSAKRLEIMFTSIKLLDKEILHPQVFAHTQYVVIIAAVEKFQHDTLGFRILSPRRLFVSRRGLLHICAIHARKAGIHSGCHVQRSLLVYTFLTVQVHWYLPPKRLQNRTPRF